MSRGKRLFVLSLFTFLVMIAVGNFMGHHNADPAGTGTGTVTDYQGAAGLDTTVKDVPVSQVGINQLANEAGHLRVSINFTWLLMTGYLVLFMQVGFAMLVTGLTRAKNAGHMMMMNVAAFAIAFVAYYACGFAFHFGGVAPVANLGGLVRLDGIFPHGNAGLIGLRGFFLQSHGTYDVGVLAMFLFQV
ncbi:MAG: ammonium transporter, Amt family, partial [Actinomycetota bacterium]|nr:ammonium transporter, Amt family [Actinomycetota bacterium]